MWSQRISPQAFMSDLQTRRQRFLLRVEIGLPWTAVGAREAARAQGPMAMVAAGAAMLDGVPTGLRAAGHILAAASASEAGRLWLPLAVDALLRGEAALP